MDESETIQLKFMRKMDYKNPYMYDKVSIKKIKEAITYLVKQDLFIEKNISVSSDWFNDKDVDVENFIVDPLDKRAYEVTPLENNESDNDRRI
jgi:hypothetical protein